MMMKNLALCATFMTYFAGFAQPASAQQTAIPTNFPPADYTGRQFVDNAGCVFVRAGFDGHVTWVPRVTRQRQAICGQTPTFGGSRTVTAAAAPAPRAAAPAPAPAPAAPAAPVQITLAPTAPAPAPVRAAPQPVMRTAATNAPRVAVPAAPRVIMAPASKPVAAEPPRVLRPVPVTPSVTAPTTVRIPSRDACQSGKAYRMVGNTRVEVRCGPQTQPHVTIVRRGEAPAPGKNVHYNRSSWQDSNLAPQTRIVPRHVYENRDTQVATVPAGYRPAWEDDRLNPYRAIQTVAGFMETQEVWTNQVPRRLINQAEKQKRFPANLWTRKYKHSVQEPVIAYRAAEGYPPAEVQRDYAAQAPYRTDVLSTRSSTTTSGGGYVQIGLFSTPAKAQAAAARLAAAGFPVQQASVTRGGAAMQSLRVGPYGTETAVDAALAAVHRTGYTQAYIR